jgi:hypothetical protein
MSESEKITHDGMLIEFFVEPSTNLNAYRTFRLLTLYSKSSDMKKKTIKKRKRLKPNLPGNTADSTSKTDLTGYPPYSAKDDVYNRFTKEESVDPDDLSKRKSPNEDDGVANEKDFKDDVSGADLDIPGAELDDQQENVGSEDEENNYYSIGGDNHNDLEESKE